MAPKGFEKTGGIGKKTGGIGKGLEELETRGREHPDHCILKTD